MIVLFAGFLKSITIRRGRKCSIPFFSCLIWRLSARYRSTSASAVSFLKVAPYLLPIEYRHVNMFTHVDLARRAKSIGFVPKGEIIWYQAGTKLRPYGYPRSYVPNIAHQYIVILQRPRPAP